MADQRGLARRFGTMGLLLAASGCASAPPAGAPGGPVAGAPNCFEMPGKAVPGSAFFVALDGTVDASHAPVPADPSEAVVFRLLYGTLTEVDCAGAVRPSLAAAWEASPDTLSWTFRLRRDVWLAHAERDDRVPLDADAVRDAWQDTRRRLRDSGELPWTWRRVLLRDVRVDGPDRLTIGTAVPEPDLPALLSRPEFAVAVREPGDEPLAWPRGTCGVISDAAPDAAQRDLVWWPESKDEDATVARITFRVRPGADPRDRTEADLLFARDRAAVAYFASREDLRAGPELGSARLVLLTRNPELAGAITPEAKRDLATRATSALASASEAAAISFDGGSPGAAPDSVRFLHDATDATAGDVARRLAAVSPRRPAVAIGLAPGAFAAALREGRGEAFVVRVPFAPVPDLEREQLLGLAPWLAGGRAVPLLDPRVALVARRGLTGIRAGRDGVPRLERAGWERGAQP